MNKEGRDCGCRETIWNIRRRRRIWGTTEWKKIKEIEDSGWERRATQ
jgi:hypothetical protein